jgi:hypothetical protein
MIAYKWLGSEAMHLDAPHLTLLGDMVIGCYGGNRRAGATQNDNFYEWVGKVNTFELPIPCFASGVRELRQGANHILMVTDGLLECGSRPFEDARALYDLGKWNGEEDGFAGQERVEKALARVHEEQGRDSATVIQWSYKSVAPCATRSG